MFFLTNTLVSQVPSSLISYGLMAIFLLVGLVPLIMGLSGLSAIRRLRDVVLAALNHCEYRIGLLEGCQMENLPVIRQLVEEEAYPKLSETFLEFSRDSSKLFHGKWTTDLRKYIDREHLLTQQQYRRISNDMALRVLAIGLLSSTFFLLLCLTIGQEISRRALPVSLFPALTGTIFAFLLYSRSGSARQDLDEAMKKWAETASLRLPVFSDLAGSAVLVDAFMQYDRKMEASVNRLSTTVSSLLNHEMVQAVSASIEESITSTIAPSIQESNRSVVQLATDLSQRQERGMAELADRFAGHVSEILARRLETFFNALDSYTQQLNETKGETAIALEALETYRQEAARLDEQLKAHFQAADQRQEALNEKVERLSSALEALGQASQNLSELQAGSTNSLASLVSNLGQQVTGFAQSMTQLTKEIREENDVNRQAIRSLLKEQDRTTAEYRQLSETMVTAGQSLNRQADLIGRQLEGVHQQLGQSIDHFTRSIGTGLNQTLGEMDEALGEISDRLSLRAAEIYDSARLAQANEDSGQK